MLLGSCVCLWTCHHVILVYLPAGACSVSNSSDSSTRPCDNEAGGKKGCHSSENAMKLQELIEKGGLLYLVNNKQATITLSMQCLCNLLRLIVQMSKAQSHDEHTVPSVPSVLSLSGWIHNNGSCVGLYLYLTRLPQALKRQPNANQNSRSSSLATLCTRPTDLDINIVMSCHIVIVNRLYVCIKQPSWLHVRLYLCLRLRLCLRSS